MSKVVSIEESSEYIHVFDPVCDGDHAYVADGFVNHNCVLWIDEIEKGISGTQSSARTDGGTMNRIFSMFLTWMQEKKKPVFVVGTANAQEEVPPEFLRRFDEIFFLDLPNLEAREQIFGILLRRIGRDPTKFDLDKLAHASNHYSGAEIEKAINEALFDAYEDSKRPLVDADVVRGLKSIRPLHDIRKEDFEELREWAKGRCKIANDPVVATVEGGKEKRAKDLDLT